MSKTAYLFPGQGSQVIGMGDDLFGLPAAQAKLTQAKDILGWSVPDICNHPEDKVSNTLYTQPCLYTIESILVDLLNERGQTPDLVAGHSLGEYVALYTAGVFDFADGLRLVKRRAELMSNASDGTMAALIGVDRAQLDELLAKTANVVLANDNSDAQVVISGSPNAVDTVLGGVKAKRKVKLNVSGAFHSPLMANAAAEFQPILESVTFRDATIPVLSNVDPTAETGAIALKNRLMQQMTGSVRWREISLHLPKANIETVVEVGPGKVLTGLVKRTCSGLTLKNISTLAEIRET